MLIKQIINSIFNSNSYILYNENDINCWIVDCGDADPLVNWINNHKKKLVGIFITHTHYDHIYGLNQIVSLFPDCIIYTSSNGKEGLFSSKLNVSRYNCTSFIYQFENISVISEHDHINLFNNITINVIETPGHDWSCLTYQCGKHIFTGDSFLPDYTILTKFPKSDKILANRSLINIKEMIKSGAENVYPGHGDIKLSLSIYNI